MTSLGQDIKEVLAEVGMPIVIRRTPEDIAGEFAKPKLNAQATKPFIREFFLQAELAHDSAVIPGDVVVSGDGRTFIVMNKTPDIFEGEIYRYSAVFYKCNVEGGLYRPASGREKYSAVLTWTAVQSPCPALLTESRYGHELDDDAELGPVSLSAIDGYLPHVVGARKGDRYEVTAGEYYQVESIRYRHFDSVDLLSLGEDRRGARS